MPSLFIFEEIFYIIIQYPHAQRTRSAAKKYTDAISSFADKARNVSGAIQFNKEVVRKNSDAIQFNKKVAKNVSGVIQLLKHSSIANFCTVAACDH